MFDDDMDEEIRTGLERLASAISEQYADVRDWREDVVYFLQALEMQAMAKDPDHPRGFETMIDDLRANITNRLAENRWE
ncbi:MAG TPA: hypothetical protein VFZ76_08690 [Anaerolineales bacterium]